MLDYQRSNFKGLDPEDKSKWDFQNCQRSMEGKREARTCLSSSSVDCSSFHALLAASAFCSFKSQHDIFATYKMVKNAHKDFLILFPKAIYAGYNVSEIATVINIIFKDSFPSQHLSVCGS